MHDVTAGGKEKSVECLAVVMKYEIICNAGKITSGNSTLRRR